MKATEACKMLFLPQNFSFKKYHFKHFKILNANEDICTTERLL